jgi:hypothetical protein
MKKIIIGILMMFVIQSSLYATVPTQENVTKLYVATFNRAPDTGGLDYWVRSSGLDLEGISKSFFEQPETQEVYPSDSTTTDFVDAVYSNLFNRVSDQEGLNYWVGELDSGRIAKSVFILAVINGAQNTEEFGNDATILSNKTIVGLAFANAGLNDLADAAEIMLGVTDDESTVTDALLSYSIEEASENIIVKFLDLSKSITENVTFTYDDNGNRLTETREEEQFNTKIKYESEYSYNFSSHKAIETWSLNGGPETITGTNIYTFDDNGVIVNAVLSDSTGHTSNATYTYDELGTIKRYSSISDNGGSEVRTYDVNGNEITVEIRAVLPDGSTLFSSSETYTYDANGNMLTHNVTLVSNDGTVTKFITTFDEFGNIIEQIMENG